MGISKFEVVLEGGVAAYNCGQDVTGCVEIVVGSLTACKAVLVKAHGACKVDYLGSLNEEVYLDETITVWCGANHGDNLQPGTHMFPFQFQVPDRVPTTFEGEYGNIHYFIKARIDIPWGEPLDTAREFMVDSNYDLIQDEDATLPLRFHMNETVCCCCCEQGPVLIALTAEKTGYIPGEYILLTGEVTNRAGWHIEGTKLAIHQKIKYVADSTSHTTENTIQKMHRPGIRAGDTDVWLSVPLRVPDNASGLQYCNIMSVKYDVEITFSMGFCSDTYVKESIIVGANPVGKVTMAMEGLVPSPSAPKPSAPPLCNSDSAPPLYNCDSSPQELKPILSQDNGSQELKPIVTQPSPTSSIPPPTAI